MHNEVRQQLCKLIAQYGNALSEDSRRCNALLKDHCGQYKREIFVLVNALENRVGTELINASAGVPISLLLARLVKRLEDELGLSETAAKWAVETWALALGVIDQPIPVSVPESPKPVSPVSQTHSIPATVSVPTSSTGGRLLFPKFSVGKVKIGSKEHSAVGEIIVLPTQTVELIISNDVTDFSFLKTCDFNQLVNKISLSGCNINDLVIEYLNNFDKLQSLDLTGCIGYAVNFSKLKIINLESLNLSNCYSFNLQGIQYFSNLQSLNLSGCPEVDDGNLVRIRNLINLKEIDLTRSGKKGVKVGRSYHSFDALTDKGLTHIGNLKNLEIINLSGNESITGPGLLTNLDGFKNLKLLNLSGCNKITDDRIKELRTMLLTTKIIR